MRSTAPESLTANHASSRCAGRRVGESCAELNPGVVYQEKPWPLNASCTQGILRDANPPAMSLWILVGLIVAGAVTLAATLAVRLGVHQRLPLAFGPMSLDRIPDRAARKYGDRVVFTTDAPCAWEVPALRERYPDPTAWSPSRIKATAGYVAALLRSELGVERGDRVAVLKANHLDMHIFNISIVRAGGVACPINGKFATNDVQPYLDNIGAKVLISDVATVMRVLGEGGNFGGVTKIVLAEKSPLSVDDATRMQLHRFVTSTAPHAELLWLEDALGGVHRESDPVRRSSDEPLYLVHSSGTTGFPKAVVLKNGRQSRAVRGWLCYVHVSRNRDKGFVAAPNNHQAVILSFNSALLLGLRVHWSSAYHRDGLDPEGILEQLAAGGFTGFFGFPIAYTQLKEIKLDRYDLHRMRFWASTADASHETIQRHFVAVGGAFRGMGLPVTGSVYLDAQGSSEVGTPSVLRYVTPFTKTFERRIGRAGSVPFGPALRIVRATGEVARRGETGRLEVRGRTVFDAYWNDQTRTSQAFSGGWFFTGDIARRATDGHFIQLDREVDVIHTRHGDVYTLPMEEKIHKHPAVFDACVYRARHSDGTQTPAAAIALRAGFEITVESLTRDLNALLGAEERLQHVDIVPWNEFPIGVTGKTLKRVFSASTEPSTAQTSAGV
jgi:acyl-coenzyme A synthetase/AMP-(fatty) acid ligase